MLNKVVGQERAKQALALLSHGYKRRGIIPPIGIFGGSGLGKCFAKGTMIRMYDGSAQAVEDIQNGEYVMGDDSTPRLVEGVTSGRDEMFRITSIKGESFVVNLAHILVLVHTNTGVITEISIQDYLQTSTTFKHKHKLYRAPIEYDSYPTKIDPYYIGLWLGDGDWNRPYVTNIEPEVHNYIKQLADQLEMIPVHATPKNRCEFVSLKHATRLFNTRGKRVNKLKENFKSYGLMLKKEKFIPREYLINDRSTRLQLLAGLIDSDGSYYGGIYEITSKYYQLAKQIQELSLSLGFYASIAVKTVNNVDYYKLIISGALDEVPTKVPRKQATPRQQIKNVRRTGFTVQSIGRGKYYGFTVDQNHRFLLANFIVTHNTHLVTEWAEEIGAKVVYINGTSIKDALAFRGFFKEAREDARNYYVMFVDEAHGLPNKVQDNLLSVLEDPAILCTVAPRDIGRTVCVDGVRYIEKGDVMREELPKNMSFIMATTDPAQLKEPILNRLRKIQLTPYTMDDKIEIALAHLVEHGVSAEETILVALATRSRSVRHLKKELCETFMDIHSLYGEDAESTLVTMDDMLGIDPDGATDLDVDYLEYLVENNTVGLDTMAGRLRIDKKELTKTIEPFLLSKGWIAITGKGRRLTAAGFTKVVGDDAVTTK